MAQHSKFLVVCAAAACTAGAAYISRIAYLEYKKRVAVRKFVDDVKSSFATPEDVLLEISQAMRDEMAAGLKGTPGACLKMLPTYVDNLPNGSEKGVFYALDLGGTNFRVMRVHLLGPEERVGKTEFVGGMITPDLMKGDKEDLFDMMACKLANFAAAESPEFRPEGSHHRELGFTFSFPCDQTAINSGKLIRWTKGFSVRGVEGQDVVRIMEEAFHRQGVDIKITALVNDAVGTLAGARYTDPDAVIAVILGTGSNACYEEKDDVSWRLVGPPPASGHMVVNIEWGNFNSPLLPVTSYDGVVDVRSPNPGEQQLEKLVSGMYLGEILRLILVDLESRTGFMGAAESAKLFCPNSLSTPYLSKIHNDSTPYLTEVHGILEQVLDVRGPSYFVRRTVQDLASMVCARGARIVAAALVGVLRKMGRDDGSSRTVIAVDGGLYENYRQYRQTMLETMDGLLGEKAASMVTTVLSKDGSGIGAALLAASHSAYSWK